MRKKPRFKEDDLAIWRKVQSSVRPLPHSDVSKARHEKAGTPAAKSSANARVSFSKTTDPKAPPKPAKTYAPHAGVQGLQRAQRRALQKGQLEADARLDLHGLRLDDARLRLGFFLHEAARLGQSRVLVITGKGGHPRHEPHGVETSGVIRRAFPGWMHERELARLVSHYTPAHVKHGGEGAWYVFIRAEARRMAQKR